MIHRCAVSVIGTNERLRRIMTRRLAGSQLLRVVGRSLTADPMRPVGDEFPTRYSIDQMEQGLSAQSVIPLWGLLAGKTKPNRAFASATVQLDLQRALEQHDA